MVSRYSEQLADTNQLISSNRRYVGIVLRVDTKAFYRGL